MWSTGIIVGGYINPPLHHGIGAAGVTLLIMGNMHMTYDPDRHHRRSIRLRGYDYAQPGAYFVTICTQDRHALFGGIAGGALRLNDAGRMVERWWDELNRKFRSVVTDTFVVMPDHIHGIIVIAAGGDANDVSLSMIIQWFKIMTTTEYIRHVKQSGWMPFNRRVWQRNYYEHIIRDDEALDRLRRYIATNPARWTEGRDDIDMLLARMQVKD
jgi:putative transposase